MSDDRFVVRCVNCDIVATAATKREAVNFTRLQDELVAVLVGRYEVN